MNDLCAAAENLLDLRTRVLLLSGPDGVPLDVALGAIPFELSSIRRATSWRVLGI